MTTINDHRALPAVNYNASPSFFARASRALAEWRLYRQTRAELEALSDRELVDLGISRYDIDAIARQSVYGA
jgi:uncharacterized protein YjiS (DUF1127 family)